MKDKNENLADVSRVIRERLIRGEEQALEEVLDRFGGYVRSRLIRRFGSGLSEQDRDDVLSRALYRVWIWRDRYDPKRASLATWFSLIARSAALELLRERSRLSVRSLEELQHHPAEDRKAAPEEPWTADSAGLARLQELLMSLPEIDRRILLAFAASEGQGSWATDLAQDLGISASTIRSRKRRTLAQLREQLEKDGFLSTENHP